MRSMRIGKADHNRELDAVAIEAPFVGAPGKFRVFRSLAGDLFPRHRLIGLDANASIETLRKSDSLYPLDFETSLLVAVLHAKNLAHLQWMLDAGKQCAFAAQVRGSGVLEEWPAVSVHTPDAYWQFCCYPGFALRFHDSHR